MGNIFYFAWEPQMMEWLQAHLPSFAAGLFSVLTLLGEEMALVLLLGFLYWVYDKEFGMFVGVNMVATLTWNPMIKNIALRPRPYMVHEGVQCLKPVDASADIMDLSAQGYSFPSGHSANAVTAYGSLAVYTKKTWLIIAAAAVAFIVGFSRVVLGVHYPTDVMAGWTLGLIVIFLLSFLQRKIRDRRILYVILFLLAVPGFFYCKSTDYYSSFGMMIGLFAGDLFERRFVRFENTRKVIPAILRLAVGVALFFGLNTVLKMPFNKDFLASATMGSYLVRTARYALVIFLLMGVYPLCFRIGKKKEEEKA